MAASGSPPPTGHVNGVSSTTTITGVNRNDMAISPSGTAAQQTPNSPTTFSSLKRKRGEEEQSDYIKREDSDIPVLDAAVNAKESYQNGDSESSIIDEEKEQSMRPTPEESLKLASVVKMLDTQGIARELLPDEAGVSSFLEALGPNERQTGQSQQKEEGEDSWPYAFSTLEFYLDLAVSSVKSRLQARDGKGKTTKSQDTSEQSVNNMSSSSNNHKTEDPQARLALATSQVDQFVHSLKNLFEELKNKAAARHGLKRVRQGGAAPKFALHRTLGNTDIFTSAVELPTEEKYFSELRDTDVLAVHPTKLSQSTPVAKLGEISAKTKVPVSRPTDLTPKVSPVTFLYYDAYASFAPTHDSSTATLSYSQSVHYGNSRQSIAAWEKKPLPPLPPFIPAGEARLPLDQVIDPSLVEAISTQPQTSQQTQEERKLGKLQPSGESINNGASVEVIKQAIKEVEDTEVVERRLAENAELLRVLQEAQWERLRKSATPGWGDAFSRQSNNSTNNPLPKLSKLEQESAQRIQETLKSLLNARPRPSDEESPYNPLLPVNHEQYSYIKTLLIQPDASPFYGVLDKTNAKGIREGVFPKPPAPSGGGRGGGRGGKKGRQSNAAAAAAAHAQQMQQQNSQQSSNATAQEMKRDPKSTDIAVSAGHDIPVPVDASMEVDA